MGTGTPTTASTKPESGLTIVGLGPGDASLRTLAVQRALDSAERIVLRTGIHPGIEDLLHDPRVSTCDDIYERGESFDDVYRAIVERVIEAARTGALVYAVPGHPRYGERTVAAIVARAEAIGIPVTILPGMSALDAIAAVLGVDPMAEQAQIVDAAEILLTQEKEPFQRGLLIVDPARPVLVVQVYGPAVASAVKLYLADVFGDEHEVTMVTAALVPGEQDVRRLPIHELDRVPVNHLSSLWVPALDPIMASRSEATLARIVARLRAPDGCPWDRKQTYATLRDDLLNEVYEVLDAVDAADTESLTEELGDVLLVAYMLTQIAEEAGDFTLPDVFQYVNEKLVRRHPHVFGEVRADEAEQVIQNWNAIKAAEKAERAGQRGDAVFREPSPLDRWPASMPALLKAQRIISRELRKHGALPPAPESLRSPGAELLAVIERLVAEGISPEESLREALIERYGAPAIGAAAQEPSEAAARD